MIMRLLLFTIVVFAASCVSNRKSAEAYGLSMEDSLFLDKQPLRHVAYLEYLHYLKRVRCDTAGFWTSLPDTMLVKQRHPGLNARFILRHHSYYDTSIVGISYANAVAYCKWRGEVVRKEGGQIYYDLPGPEDFKRAERLASGRKDKNNWKYLFEGPPELTNIPGYVWVKSKEGGRLVEASEVPAHEITFRCKAELRPYSLSPIF
jgi:hypothetical protein